MQYNLFSHPRNKLILGSRCRCYLSYLLFLYATEIDRKWVSGVQHDYFSIQLNHIIALRRFGQFRLVTLRLHNRWLVP